MIFGLFFSYSSRSTAARYRQKQLSSCLIVCDGQLANGLVQHFWRRANASSGEATRYVDATLEVSQPPAASFFSPKSGPDVDEIAALKAKAKDALMDRRKKALELLNGT